MLRLKKYYKKALIILCLMLILNLIPMLASADEITQSGISDYVYYKYLPTSTKFTVDSSGQVTTMGITNYTGYYQNLFGWWNQVPAMTGNNYTHNIVTSNLQLSKSNKYTLQIPMQVTGKGSITAKAIITYPDNSEDYIKFDTVSVNTTGALIIYLKSSFTLQQDAIINDIIIEYKSYTVNATGFLFGLYHLRTITPQDQLTEDILGGATPSGSPTMTLPNGQDYDNLQGGIDGALNNAQNNWNPFVFNIVPLTNAFTFLRTSFDTITNAFGSEYQLVIKISILAGVVALLIGLTINTTIKKKGKG